MPNNNDNSNLPSMSVLSQMIQTTMQNKGIDQSRVQSLLNEDANGKTINYQILYKLLESAVEEIIIQYPNDPIVNELKQKLVNNLRPILELIRTDQSFDQ